MRAKAYPRYKPSGVEWLGDVPAHWDVKRLDFLASVKARLGWKGLTADEYVPEGFIFLATPNIKGQGEIDFTNVNYITAQRYYESPEIMVKVGDVLMAKDGSTLGTTNVVHHLPAPTTVNSSVAVLRPKPILNSSYFFRWLTSGYLQSIIQSMKDGQGVPHLFQADIKKFTVLLPPASEQRTIATFLDREVDRVDRLMGKKRKLIERLKEKRISLISSTVTRGLPPAVARAAGLPANTPVKPSGTDWIGVVPKHWAVMKVKFVAKMESGHTPSRSEASNWVDDECVIPWVSLNDTKHLKENDYIGDTAVKISEEGMRNSSAHLLPAGVVVFTRDATIGLSAITTCPAAVSQHIIAWVPGSKITAKYLLLSFKAMQQYLESLTFGSTLKTIGMTDVRKLVTPVPPLPEQTAIAAFLDEETAKLDALVRKVEEAAERLQEYRTALITAAVTGKIDVRMAGEQK